jgi:hypothetical protein
MEKYVLNQGISTPQGSSGSEWSDGEGSETIGDFAGTTYSGASHNMRGTGLVLRDGKPTSAFASLTGSSPIARRKGSATRVTSKRGGVDAVHTDSQQNQQLSALTGWMSSLLSSPQ